MGVLVLGALALLLTLLLLRGFVRVDVKALAKGMRFSGALALIAVAIALAALDRVSLAMLAGSFAWALFTGGQVWPRGWHFPHRSASASGGSSVQSEWLEVQLDHATGAMTGRVLAGRYQGRALDDLKAVELGMLWRDISAADESSLRLLEAYLDRRMPDWRQSGEFSAKSAATGMTREEALEVLGLSGAPSEDEIRTAHRRLILQNHPDKGGSSYLAAKINEAKDVLLA